MRNHRAEKPYNCAQCEQAVTDNSNLNTHIRKHGREKYFNCLESDQSLIQARTYDET